MNLGVLQARVRAWRTQTLMSRTCPNSSMILLLGLIPSRWQLVRQASSSSTRSLTIHATCVRDLKWSSVRVGRVTPPTTTHGNPLRRFGRRKSSRTIAKRRSSLLWWSPRSSGIKLEQFPGEWDTGWSPRAVVRIHRWLERREKFPGGWVEMPREIPRWMRH